MAESLFSAMTRDLHKSKSLILAGRSTLDSSQGQPSLAGGGLDTGSVGGDKDVLSAEQEFEELSRWCHMPGQVASSLEATSAQETEPAIESVPLTKNESEAIQMGSVEVAPILIKSVGVVKQRYRQLQRDDEIEEARKASRLKRNFAEQKKPRRVAATEAEPAEPVVLPIVPHGLRIDNLCYAKVESAADFSWLLPFLSYTLVLHRL